MVGYGSNEGDGEERDRFWNYMDRTLNSVRNGYRLCILGVLNGWIEDSTRVGIAGGFGVPGESNNVRKGVELCVERGMCVGNTYFNTGIFISTQGRQRDRTNWR